MEPLSPPGTSVLPVLLIIRLVMLGAAVQTAWLDDEEEFICNSLQPLCKVACFSKAMHLFPARLWTLQVLLFMYYSYIFYIKTKNLPLSQSCSVKVSLFEGLYCKIYQGGHMSIPHQQESAQSTVEQPRG